MTAYEEIALIGHESKDIYVRAVIEFKENNGKKLSLVSGTSISIPRNATTRLFMELLRQARKRNPGDVQCSSQQLIILYLN